MRHGCLGNHYSVYLPIQSGGAGWFGALGRCVARRHIWIIALPWAAYQRLPPTEALVWDGRMHWCISWCGKMYILCSTAMVN